MENGSKAKYIQRYIIYKIYNKEWQENTKIMSQSQLAKKFNCSLLTARNALSTFIHSGILYSWHGKGFFVAQNAREQMFGSISKKIKSARQEIKEINNLEILPMVNKLINKIGITLTSDDIKVGFTKSYYDHKKALIYYQISFLNKNEILTFDLAMIKKSLIQFLLNNGIVPNRFNETVVWGRLDVLDANAKKLGWSGEYPIIITTLFNERWIEISVKITKADRLIFSKSSKILL